MSSRLVGLVLEHYQGTPNEVLLAIAIADEADHNGGNVCASLPLLGRLSRQSDGNVRRLFRKMEASTWLQCLERSPGGRGKPSVYCINPDWVRLPTGWQPKPEQNPNTVQGFVAAKPEQNPNTVQGFTGSKPEHCAGVSDPTPLSLKTLPPVVPQFELTTDSGNAGETVLDADLRLARWMLERLRTLNPKHREPKNWARWTREIRLLRTEVEGLTHREIAAVFKWANEQRTPRPGGNFCWARVILSPGNLRAHWDRLHVEYTPPAAAKAESRLCEDCGTVPWSIAQQGQPKRCSRCADAAERVAA
jgi:hypothetical protein